MTEKKKEKNKKHSSTEVELLLCNTAAQQLCSTAAQQHSRHAQQHSITIAYCSTAAWQHSSHVALQPCITAAQQHCSTAAQQRTASHRTTQLYTGVYTHMRTYYDYLSSKIRKPEFIKIY